MKETTKKYPVHYKHNKHHNTTQIKSILILTEIMKQNSWYFHYTKLINLYYFSRYTCLEYTATNQRQQEQHNDDIKILREEKEDDTIQVNPTKCFFFSYFLYKARTLARDFFFFYGSHWYISWVQRNIRNTKKT